MSEAPVEKVTHYNIHVNGQHVTVESNILSSDAAVRLAFPDPDPATIYSVTFERAEEPRDGELLPGQTVVIRNGTEIDVTPTGKS